MTYITYMKMSKIFPIALTILGTALLSGCSSVNPPTLSYCYQVEDALVIIAPDGKEVTGLEGNLSYDTVTIVDEFGEQETIGEIRDGRFYYGDGSSLAFSEQEVVGYGGLIEGLRGTTVTCP